LTVLTVSVPVCSLRFDSSAFMAQNCAVVGNEMLLINLSTCVYCGNEATARDHIRALRDGPEGAPSWEVPCCTDCNSAASDKWFDSFDQRASYLLDRAVRKKRVRLEILLATTPLVVAALNDPPRREGRCQTCGGIIRRRSLRRLYCGPVCAQRAARDRARARVQRAKHPESACN
jgi:hypothetical protein